MPLSNLPDFKILSIKQLGYYCAANQDTLKEAHTLVTQNPSAAAPTILFLAGLFEELCAISSSPALKPKMPSYRAPRTQWFLHIFSLEGIAHMQAALKLYHQAALKNDPSAQFRLGFCYEYGIGVIDSLEQALKLYTEASEQHHLEALCTLGFLYYHVVQPPDCKKAIASFTLAHDLTTSVSKNIVCNPYSIKPFYRINQNSNLNAAYYCGLYHGYALPHDPYRVNTERNPTSGLYFFKKAALQGCKSACAIVALHYTKETPEKSLLLAYHYYQHAGKKFQTQDLEVERKKIAPIHIVYTKVKEALPNMLDNIRALITDYTGLPQK